MEERGFCVRGDIILGLLGVLTDVDYEAVVVATSDCRVVRIPADAATSALAAAGGLALALEQLGTSRRRRCERVLRRAARDPHEPATAAGVEASTSTTPDTSSASTPSDEAAEDPT